MQIKAITLMSAVLLSLFASSLQAQTVADGCSSDLNLQSVASGAYVEATEIDALLLQGEIAGMQGDIAKAKACVSLAGNLTDLLAAWVEMKQISVFVTHWTIPAETSGMIDFSKGLGHLHRAIQLHPNAAQQPEATQLLATLANAYFQSKDRRSVAAYAELQRAAACDFLSATRVEIFQTRLAEAQHMFPDEHVDMAQLNSCAQDLQIAEFH